jgi:DNA repair exonuclease SbcCD ATPase subunit
MSFLDKLKKLFEETPEPEGRKIAAAIAPVHLNELSARVESFVKDTEAKNQALKQQLEKRISLLEGEANNSIEVLRNVDLSERKEYEKIKLTVHDNLNLYIDYMRKLLSGLKKINERTLADHFNKIFSCLNEFNRASYLPYEKATYLIGREMASARLLVRQFANDISALAEQNKPLFEETRQVEKLSNLNNELEESKKLEEDIGCNISHLNKKIESLGNEAKTLGNEVQDIKNSIDYRKETEEKQKYLKKQGDLDRELQAIKQKTDFKALARVFHHDKKKAQLIKEYSGNFKAALREDETLKIIGMVNDSQNLDLSSLKELQSLLQPDSLPVLKTEKKISELEGKMTGLETEKAAAKARIHEENKKSERIAKKKKKLISEMKNLFAQMNISLKDE